MRPVATLPPAARDSAAPSSSQPPARAAVLVARLDRHGLVIEAAVAREIISKRVLELSEIMGISAITAKQYISDDAIEDIAIAMADVMVFEADGVCARRRHLVLSGAPGDSRE